MRDINVGKIFEKKTSNLSIFHDLMKNRIREILLVATVYDSYTIEREGHLFEQIYGEYYKLNLSSAPRITSAYSKEEAVEEFKNNDFDLVILMPGVKKNMPVDCASVIKDINPQVPVLLLFNNSLQLKTYMPDDEHIYLFDKIFVWNGNSDVFLAMIKCMEDSLNLENDTALGNIRVILLVEDSIRYYSRYLPGLYSVIMNEIQRLIINEDVDMRYKLLRMRARPKVILANTYEDAVEIFNKYRSYLLCVITDVEYSKDGKEDDMAGYKLVDYIKERSDTHVMMQSSRKKHKIMAEKNNIEFFYKGSQQLQQELRAFFKDHLGFGDFIFRDDKGNKIAEAKNMREFTELIRNVPDESIKYHASQNHISTWLMAKGEIQQALKMHKFKITDFESVEEIRRYIISVVRERWIEKREYTIANFSEDIFYEKDYLMMIANGAIGGKGRGIAFIEFITQRIEFRKLLNDMNVTIPKTIIIGTDEYTRFINHFDFSYLIDEKTDFHEIKKKFLAIPLSQSLKKRLRIFLNNVDVPLAVRSSGLFEDSMSQPFAGIYETYFIPNNHYDVEKRLEQLENAIKMVYASVFSSTSITYFESVDYKVEEEKMSVIIQEIIGEKHENYYYPQISGVAQSTNYYPFEMIKPEDGVGFLSVGLGVNIVEGGSTMRFSPRHPKREIVPVETLIKQSQKSFFALDLKKNYLDLIEGENATLAQLEMKKAEEHGTLDYSVSVYDADNGRVRPGLFAKGPRLVDFSSVLQYRKFDLAGTTNLILKTMERALGTPVEIEFAIDVNRDENEMVTFYLLQVKPYIKNTSDTDIDIGSVDSENLILYTEKAMGHGLINDIKDIVYVKPSAFDKMKTRDILVEVREINKKLKEDDSFCMLIGPGRWGSRDPFLGIPVKWNDISQARAIVEAGIEGFTVDASLGSHFFHNITSMNIGYFTVPHKSDKSFIDWDYLDSVEAVNEGKYVRHLRFESSYRLIMNGREGRAVVSLK
ncbi:MAG: PEP/pyruvate-binding domain-containing protein [bacterium]